MSYRIPPRLGHVVPRPTSEEPAAMVYLMHLPDGQPLVLSGSAALIWVLAAEGEPDVPAALAGLLQEPLAKITGPTVDYLAVLVAQGLLELSDPAAGEPRG